MENQRICPKTWLFQSILVTIFCCIPFGIIGIVNAISVSTAFTDGYYDVAVEKSNAARKWMKRGLYTGLVLWTVYLIIQFLFIKTFLYAQ